MSSSNESLLNGIGSAPILNLKRLVLVRGLAIAIEVLAVVIAVYGLAMHLPLMLISLVIAAHLVINLLTWLRTRSEQPVSALEFMVQLCLDVVVLTLLLYLSGGATNPFVSLLLLPLVVAAAVLPKQHVWIMAMLLVTAYGVLMFDFQTMSQGDSHHAHDMAAMGSDFDRHVIGMWFSFLLAVALVVFFVLHLAESLRERDHVLVQAREQALRDEQLVALGTLAAGAAHELGTPLSTMAVLTQDLEQEYCQDPDLQQRLGILKQQVDRCRETLAMISVSSGQLRAEGGGRVRVDQFLNNVVADWRSMRPNAQLQSDMSGVTPAPEIISEKGLRQALISFLDNAADSSPENVELTCRWSEDRLRVEIADRGAGMPEEFRAQVGKTPFTTKPEGHGLGLLLAHAIIQRLDGEVQVNERPGGGTIVVLELDLTRLLVGA